MSNSDVNISKTLRIWAKAIKTTSSSNPEISLGKHTEDLLLAFGKLENLIPKELITPIRISILFHDIGKALPSFQGRIGNKDYLKAFSEDTAILSADIPHSLFSTLLINLDSPESKEILGEAEKYKNFILSAIAYHHWREGTFESYLMHNKMKKHLSKISENQIEILRQAIIKELSSINLPNQEEIKRFISLVKPNTRLIKGIMKGNTFSTYVKSPYYNYIDPQNLLKEKDYLIISGSLLRCDHFVSWVEEEEHQNKDAENGTKITLDHIELPAPPTEEIVLAVEKRIKEKSNSNDIWQIRKFQTIKDKKLTFLIAPTGIGKTEFAFIWSNGKKTLYTLPMRSTVNQTHKRAIDKIFKLEDVGILHSDADLYLYKEYHFSDIESIRLYEMSRSLSFPFIVMTGDQIFPYVLGFPGCEKVISLLSYSNLVIDEVQAYDPKALAVVLKSLEITYTLGGKVLVMTATFPNFLEEEIKKRLRKVNKNFDSELGKIDLYEENKEDFKNIKKHLLEIRLTQQDSDSIVDKKEIEEVIEKAKEGKRVLVIMNTVKASQKIYKKIKEILKEKNLNDIKTFLIHSRFTPKDREEKEKVISEEFCNPKPITEKQGKILVATQVIEVSMDLDADVIFTEICPIDVLIQRIGRVARRYFYLQGRIFDKSTNQFKNIKDFKAYEDGKPNVFVWITEKSDPDNLNETQSKKQKTYESGKGKVYQKELIENSIILLSEELKGDFITLPFEELTDISQDSKITKTDINNLLKKLNGKTFELSEYKKYKISNKFYETLSNSGESSYISEFYETLRILDIGYNEKSQKDAQTFFRERSTVPAIIGSKMEELKEEIKKFLTSSDRQRVNYLSFKDKILSKFLVNVEFLEYRNNLRNFKEVLTEVIEDISIDQEVKRKLTRWFKDFLLLKNVQYDPEIGLATGKETYTEEDITENIL